MVKNELSIVASETYRVASSVKENNIKKHDNKINKKISSINNKVSFFAKNEDDEVFKLVKKNLKENLLKTKENNPYAAYISLYENYRQEAMLRWSFVKIDRTNPNKELVKSTIGNHRLFLVKIDNNITKAKFNYEWFDKQFNQLLNNRKEYEALKESVYKDGDVKLQNVSYAEFLKQTNAEYKSLQEKFYNSFDNFFKNVESKLDEYYELSSKHEAKEKALAKLKDINDLYNKIKQDNQHKENLNVDLQILNQQLKEKLDVNEEKENIVSSIETLKQSLASDNEKVKVLTEELLKEVEEINNDTIIDVKEDNELKDLYVSLAELFKNRKEDISILLFEAINTYIETICPNYSTFYKNKYQEYLENQKVYKQEAIANVKDELKSSFNNERKYIIAISGKESALVESQVAELKAKKEEQIAKVKDEYKDRLVKIKEAKAARIEEYHRQKENAKVVLKIADAAKASDTKEIVKLYKKEINSGEGARYAGARKIKRQQIASINKQYKIDLSKIVNPEPISYQYEANIKSRSLKIEKIKALFSLNKFLNKEKSISKYHRNTTIAKRESRLGYFFLAIWGIGFLVFTLVPIFYSILLVFSDINRYTVTEGYPPVISIANLFNGGKLFPNWSGSDNFEVLFLSDVMFAYTYVPRFFRNLLLFVPIIVFISFVLALLLNTKIKGRTIFRVIYFLPVVIVSGPVLKMLNDSDQNKGSSIKLNLDGSSIAIILGSISPKLLQYANEVFQNFIIILWMTGVPVVLFISALQKINRSLYEAADIDGANGWQKLWTITFPLIKSIMLIVCLFTIMQVTTINYSGINPINDWINNQISSKHFSWAALGSWVQTLIVLLFVLVAFLLFREKEFVSKQKSFEEMEAYKARKEARRAKVYEFFHIGDVKNFFTKITSPISKFINVTKEKIKTNKEMKGDK